MPSMPGIIMSSTSASYSEEHMCSSASAPLCTMSTVYLFFSSMTFSARAMLASSSASSIRM